MPSELFQQIRDATGPFEIDPLRADRADVVPRVAEVELVDELVAGMQATQAGPTIIERGPELLPVLIRRGQTGAVREFELMEVRSVPAGEGVIDRDREIGERVGSRGGEDAAGTRSEMLAMSFDEVHPNGQPGARHRPPCSRVPRPVLPR